jgi:RNA polymerase-binding transcription factor DksA
MPQVTTTQRSHARSELQSRGSATRSKTKVKKKDPYLESQRQALVERMENAIKVIKKEVIEESLRASKKRQLQHIRTALTTIATSPAEYGVCSTCGEDIDRKRLDIIPEARRCVDCESDVEKLNVRRPATNPESMRHVKDDDQDDHGDRTLDLAPAND